MTEAAIEATSQEEHKKEEPWIHDGNFKTQRPESLDPEVCEDI